MVSQLLDGAALQQHLVRGRTLGRDDQATGAASVGHPA
jgi:hypothetical protein